MAAHELNIQKLVRENLPVEGELSLDLAGRDFGDFSVLQPVSFRWNARPEGGIVRFSFSLEFTLSAECARCLDAFEEAIDLTKDYDLDPAELQGEFPEFPIAANGVLDLDEFVFGEVLLEAPILLLCREDCEGLCPTCGKRKSECSCPGQPPETDTRWHALQALLDNEEPG